MFAVLDSKGRLIAYHDEKRVVEKYADSVRSIHHITLNVKKIKKRSKYKLKGREDLYLVKYGKTYIQEGYVMYIELSDSKFEEDECEAKDVLLRILELNELSSKDTKAIARVIRLLDKMIYEKEHYTPSFNELKDLKESYDPYIYNYGMYE